MRRIQARAIAAEVINLPALRNRSMNQFPGEAMRKDFPKTAHGEHPVTRAVRMCAPFPASMLMSNDAPLESFQEYAKVPCQTIRREVREDVPTTSALSPQ
jgi:hypothetical protein